MTNKISQTDKPAVKLFEDNAGGLWLVDTDQVWAWSMGNMGNSFYADAIVLFGDDVADWAAESRYPYSEEVEPHDQTKLVAEYDGSTIKMYPDAMGDSAKQYCGLRIK